MNKKVIENLTVEAKKDKIQRIVVTGVIFHSDKCLLLKRKEGDFLGGFFEAPGGLVNSSETLIEALYRELKEETNLSINNVIDFVSSFDYISSNGLITRNFTFIVSVNNDNNINITEHQNFVWISREEINNYNMTQEMLETIKEAWKVKISHE